jgi:hypothetical protein
MKLLATAVALAMSILPTGHATAKKVDHCPQWRKTALEAGWHTRHLGTLDRLMHRESRCRPGVINSTLNRDGSWDYGLLQINDKTWCLPSKYAFRGYLQAERIVKTCQDLLNPSVNLVAALAIYQAAGDSFSPWGL